MGNCVNSKLFCGKSSKISDEEALEIVRRSFMAYHAASSSLTAVTTTEVKIKITKTELEKLLDNFKVVEVEEEMPTVQWLSQLVDFNDVLDMQLQPWQPSLQSIPEVD